jgi:rhamnosyltransferase subunit B
MSHAIGHTSRRIVFATIGSLGDLHPIVAFALGLKARGHEVEIATSESYREKVRALDLPFHPLRPDLLSEGEHIVAEIMDGARGSERLMKERIFPAVRQMHADLTPVVEGADLLVASELVTTASILAATHQIRWVSYELAPVSLFSLHDPPIFPAPEVVRWIQGRGWFCRLVKAVGKRVSHSWWKPIRELRRELGLPPGEHPLFEGKYSPLLNLALFSPVLQAPQPDWPRNTVQSGFLFHDEPQAYPALPAPVRSFLAAGEPPIVFTLGSAAVYLAGSFYHESVQAALRLGRRALLLLGKNPPPQNLPPSVLAWDYLPYAQIFPDATAVVHQGGVGTTAQTLRAGRPMLVVPFAHDQFDNAARMVRLGVARTLSRARYRAERVARELDSLLDDAPRSQTAAAVGARVRTERGVEAACDAIERVL